MVFFDATEDPELFDILVDGISKSLRVLSVDAILTILVNFGHTLNPSAHELFQAARQELMQRLNFEYHSLKVELYISPEDLIKILNVFLEAK